jgi:hypothetical protein
MNLPSNLCYTIALDQPGRDVHRRMARLLVTSLLRTGWYGRIVVFRNTPKPVLPEGSPNVEELLIEAPPEEVFRQTPAWKYRVRNQLDLTGIGKVLLLDCDCIALRNINHLMLGSWDLYTAPEPFRLTDAQFNGYFSDREMASLGNLPGLNSGTIGIRASEFLATTEEWERLDRREQLRTHHVHLRDQHSWNRLILDTPLRHRSFGQGEVQFPFLNRAIYADYRSAAIVHAAGQTASEKLALLYGLWMETFGIDHLDAFTAPIVTVQGQLSMSGCQISEGQQQ